MRGLRRMPKIKVEFYGVLEQVCGTRAADLALAGGESTVGGALSRLVEIYPGLRAHREYIACAVDAELTTEAAPLHEGAVLALLPPVSGG